MFILPQFQFSKWKSAIATAIDPYFKYTSLLLKGDSGIVGANGPNPTFADSSSNNFTITRNGSPLQTSLNPFGPNGWSGYFDGSTISAPANAAFNYTGAFTVECWYYPVTLGNGLNGYDYIFAQSSSGNQALTFNYYNTKIQVLGGNSLRATSTTVITTNKWYHIAVVRDGTGTNQARLYINGVLDQTFTLPSDYTSSPNNNLAPTFGGFNYTTANCITGYISNARIVSGYALYSGSTITVPTAPLTSVTGTSFLALQDSRFKDNSSNGFAITPAGSPRIQPFSPFAAKNQTTWGGYFDGGNSYLTISNTSITNFGTGDYTVEFWAKLSSLSTQQNIIDNLGTSGHALYQISGTIYWYTGSPINNKITSNANALQNDVWAHIALCRYSSTTRLYINGIQTGSDYTSDANNYSGSSTRIGIASNGTFPILNGYISNLRITKGLAVYTTNFTPPTAPFTLGSNGGASPANLPSPSQVSLLTLQDTTFKDNSLNNFTITSTGSPTTVQNSPFVTTTGYAAGVYGGSGYFDGSSYLSTPNNSSNNFASGTPCTIEFWINPTAYPTGSNEATIISNWSSTTTGWRIGIYNSNIYFYTNGEKFTTPISLNSWTHIAVTHDGTNTSLYKNGSLIGSNATTTWNQATKAIYIGANDPSANIFYFTGYISNLRIVKGLAVYTGAFTPPTSPVSITANGGAVGNNTAPTAAQTSLLLNFANGGVMDSANKNAITINSNVAQGSFNPYGPNGWSGYITGSNYLTLGSNPDISSGDFTMECWVQPISTTSNYQAIMYRGTGTADGQASAMMYAEGNGQLWFRSTTNGSTWTNAIGPGPTLTGGVWTHLAVVRYNNNFYLYKDGVQVGSASPISTTLYNTNQKWQFGYFGTFLTSNWNGYISNVRVVNSAVYTANFTPPTSPLTKIANTSLLTLQSNRFKDNSSNSFALSANGSPQIQPVSPFVSSSVDYTQTAYNWSGYFDSTSSASYLSTTLGAGIGFGTGDFTIEAWVYHTGDGDDTLISDGGACTFTYGAAGKLRFYTGANQNIVDATVNYISNAWTHVAVVRSGTNLYFYQNGTNVGTITNYNFTISNGTTTYIGNLYSPRTGDFKGYISNLRVVKGTAVYTANFTPPTAPLTAITNTQLLALQSNSLTKDNSSNNFTLTNTNTKLQPISPFLQKNYPPGSGYFNGSNAYLEIANNTALQLDTGDFTIEFWWNGSASGSFAQNVGTLITNADNGVYKVGTRYNGTNVLNFARANGSIFEEARYNVNVNDGTWHHIACVRRSGLIRMFVDGIEQTLSAGTANIAGTCTSSNPLKIGYGPRDATYSSGYMSNVRIIKGTALYTQNFIPSTTPLTNVNNTSLLTLVDYSLKDYSTNNLTLINNNVVNTEVSPFSGSGGAYAPTVYGGSAYFDGSSYLSVSGTGFSGATALDLSTTTTSAYTLEFWLYKPNVSIVNLLHFKGSGVTNGTSIYTGSNNELKIDAGYAGAPLTTFTQNICANVWNHIAFVKNGSTTTAYLNGTSIGSTTTYIPAASNTLQIGAFNGTANFNGYISNLRLINGTAVVPTSATLPTAPLSAVANTSLLLNFADGGVVDSTGKNNVVTVGSAGVSKAQYKYGSGSYYFDGSSGYMKVPTTPNLQLGSSDWCIECWVYFNSTSGNQRIISQNDSNYEFAFYSANGSVTAYSFTSTGTQIFAISMGTLSINQWYHIACTKSGTNVRAFVNGSQVGSTATGIGTIDARTGGWKIGASYSNTELFNGYIDDLRITKGIARYTSNFTPPATHPTQ